MPYFDSVAEAVRDGILSELRTTMSNSSSKVSFQYSDYDLRWRHVSIRGKDPVLLIASRWKLVILATTLALNSRLRRSERQLGFTAPGHCCHWLLCICFLHESTTVRRAGKLHQCPEVVCDAIALGSVKNKREAAILAFSKSLLCAVRGDMV
jgi:hypothetical protein